MYHRIVLQVILLVASLMLLVSCAVDSNSGTPVDAGEQGVETFTFGLPSTETFDDTGRQGHQIFRDGKKFAWPEGITTSYAVLSAGNNPATEGTVSLIREWRLIYNPFDGTYVLRSGRWREIRFRGGYAKVHPTVAMLREIFGKWIIFKGDDMSRVREVVGPLGLKVLIFNDGRLPADTYTH